MTKPAKRVLILVGVLVAVLGGLWIWAPGDVEYDCHVGGALTGPDRCTFTHEGYVPGRLCLRVHVVRGGLRTSSAKTCSGILFGDETKVVPVVGFDEDPRSFCRGSWDDCEMVVTRFK
jgi:hypothetical protein